MCHMTPSRLTWPIHTWHVTYLYVAQFIHNFAMTHLQAHTQIEILKRQRTTQFARQNDYKADFWEYSLQSLYFKIWKMQSRLSYTWRRIRDHKSRLVHMWDTTLLYTHKHTVWRMRRRIVYTWHGSFTRVTQLTHIAHTHAQSDPCGLDLCLRDMADFPRDSTHAYIYTHTVWRMQPQMRCLSGWKGTLGRFLMNF